jgi:hypothetical protein
LLIGLDWLISPSGVAGNVGREQWRIDVAWNHMICTDLISINEGFFAEMAVGCHGLDGFPLSSISWVAISPLLLLFVGLAIAPT